MINNVHNLMLTWNLHFIMPELTKISQTNFVKDSKSNEDKPGVRILNHAITSPVISVDLTFLNSVFLILLI